MSQSNPPNTSTKTLRGASLSIGKKELRQSNDSTVMGLKNDDTNNTVQNTTNNNTEESNNISRTSSVDSTDSAEDEASFNKNLNKAKMVKMLGVTPETLELVLSSKSDNKKVIKILGVNEDNIMSGKYNESDFRSLPSFFLSSDEFTTWETNQRRMSTLSFATEKLMSRLNFASPPPSPAPPVTPLISRSMSTGNVVTAVKAKPRWDVDHEWNLCKICSQQFTAFVRRHHCRMCGSIVCGHCSESNIPLEEYGYKGLERVCDHCYIKYLEGFSVPSTLNTVPFAATSESSSTPQNTTPQNNNKINKDIKETYGLAHTFQQYYLPIKPVNCSFCDTLIMDLSYYWCPTCDYYSHKKCCPLVPNTCSNRTQPLVKSVNVPVGSRLTRKELEELHYLWKEQDFDEVTTIQFSKLYQKLIKPQSHVYGFGSSILDLFSDNESFRLFKYIDRGNDGKISFEEAALFMSILKAPAPEEQIEIIFILFDSNLDGSISKRDLVLGLKRVTPDAPGLSVFGIKDEDFDLLEVVAESVFETAGVPSNIELTVHDVVDAYKRDPSILVKFCGG